MINAILNWWCEHVHGGFMWPLNGAMICRTCQRKAGTLR
jgi:hypothetical protein